MELDDSEVPSIDITDRRTTRLKHADFGTDIGEIPPYNVSYYLCKLYRISQIKEQDDMGRISWARSIESDTRRSVARESELERDIVHARLFLDPNKGSFARLAVYLKQEDPRESWSPQVVAAFHAVVQGDANHNQGPGYRRITSSTI